MTRNQISRRKFIGNAAKGAAVLTLSGLTPSCSLFGDKTMPRRTLGKTGLDVSILSFGGGSQFMKNGKGEWEKHMELAIESGINYFDMAPSYSGFKLARQDMGSEERFGEFLPGYRDQVIISTKLEGRDPKKVKEEIEGSLKKLKTSYIDIYLMHAINDSDNLTDIEKGIYKELVQLKQAGIVRYVGFSSMDSAGRSREILDNLDIDVAMLAMNPTRYGDFARIALPSAIKQNSGVVAIKAMRDIVGKEATARELLAYNWDHEGVAANMVAHDGLKPFKENIRIACDYQDLAATGTGDLKAHVTGIHHQELEARMNRYAGPHALCWARPGYRDGGEYYYAGYTA